VIISLQVLRGIAVLLVVYYHAHGLLIKRHEELGLKTDFWMVEQGITKFGAIGVDIFFVLSGFIIFYTSRSNLKTRLNFIKDRVIRIFPIWGIALTVLLLFSAFPGVSASYSIMDILLSYLLIPMNYNGGVKPILEVGWSLYYELFFYFMFAVFLSFGFVNRLILMTIAAFFSVWLGYFYTSETAIFKIATHGRIFEFIAGGWIAYYYSKGIEFKSGLMIISFLMIVCFSFGFILVDWWRLEVSGLITRGPIAVLLVLIALHWKSEIVICKNLLLFLGEASYSIYLFHMFPLILLSGIWKRDMLILSFLNGYFYWFVAFLAGVIAGILAYVYLEKPATKFIKSLL
jgi:exopolysaccharide production protein ExoZ